MKLPKNLAKQLLSKSIYHFLSLLKNRCSSPYSLKTAFGLPKSISDFFVWSPFARKTYFVAENIRALIKGEKVKVTHCLRFYSSEGLFLREEAHCDDNYFCRIEIKGSLDAHSYCSFTHHVQCAAEDDDPVENSFKYNTQLVCEQNRGYCIYYPNFESSIGSMVHGNFGGISNCETSLARQRALHMYTPSYLFESQNEYDLVFNNPTRTRLNLSIFYNSSTHSESKTIEPLGTCSVRIINYGGTLSFQSKLPICRPIIFKNPDCNLSQDFDVLHA